MGRRIGVEGALREQLGGRAVGVLDHVKIVKEDSAGAEQPDDELLPLTIRTDGARGSDRAIPDLFPDAPRGLVARGPGLGRGVVGVRVTQLEARSAAVGCHGPASVGEVANLVSKPATGVLKGEALSPGREPALEDSGG